MNSISITSKKANKLAKDISLALIFRNVGSEDSNEFQKLVKEISTLLGTNSTPESKIQLLNDLGSYTSSSKIFEILGDPSNTLSFSEGLGRNGVLTIYIVGESELRYSINIINPDLDAIRDYESFVNESPKYAYTFFFQDLLIEKSLKQIDFRAIQEIMTRLNVWHGDIEIFGGVQPSIFIEDNSNNPSKEFFKTIIQSVKLQAALTPYIKDVDEDSISTRISYKANINLSIITDIFKDQTALRTISVDITFDDKNAINKFSSLRNYSTKIPANNPLFDDVYDLFENLLL